MEVAADPPGHEFVESVTIELLAPGASEIYYTVDGQDPTSDSAQLYDGTITLTEDTYVSFIAVRDDVWSHPQRELYQKHVAVVESGVLGRALQLTDDNISFSADHNDNELSALVTVRSVGLEPVRISRIFVGPGEGSWSHWEAGIFLLSTQYEMPLFLHPGMEVDLVVVYRPTETLRTGELVIESNDERVADGRLSVDLSGRIWNW